MKTLALCLALVAGAAAAQPATMNCRSSATPCSASIVIVQTNSCISLDGNSNCTGAGAGHRLTWDGVDIKIMAGGSTFLACNNSTGVCNAPFGYSSNIAAGSIAFSATVTGAWWKLGAGAADRIKSDGTNLVSDTHVIPSSADALDLGTTASYWRTAYLSRGTVLNQGAVAKWTAAPISDNTEQTSQVLFNDTAQEPLYGSSSRKYNPLGQAKEWTVEKRTMVADVGLENTNCPLAAPGLKGTGAAGVTYACTDAAAATSVTVSGESYRQSNTTATSASVSLVDVSGNVTKLELGPKQLQRVSIPSGSTANVRIWVALVPTATSLSGVDTGAISVIGFRFSTAVPDTNWQACSGDGASVVCTNTGIAPTTGTNLTLEIDCRETTACRFLINGSLVATRSSTLPTSTTQLAPRVLVQTLTTTAKGLGFGRAALQTN